MGNLSEHFNKKDFACRCGQCGDQWRVSLTLVGVLEAIAVFFGKPVKIVEAYRCPQHPKVESTKNNRHAQGKAADFYVLDIPLNELFNYAQKIPEISGLGFYPQDKFIHIEVSQEPRKLWISQAGNKETLTQSISEEFDLKIEPPAERERKPAEIKWDKNGF